MSAWTPTIAAWKLGEEGYEICGYEHPNAESFQVRPYGATELEGGIYCENREDAERIRAAFVKCFEGGRRHRQAELRAFVLDDI